MVIGIIHLTDLHIGKLNTPTDGRINAIISAMQGDFKDCNSLYIVISGDIVNKGDGFFEAKTFLSKLTKGLVRFSENNNIKLIMVPGNHDCNFSRGNQVRDIILQSVHGVNLQGDNSVVDTCLEVQTDFWEFYQELNGNAPENKLVYQVKDKIDEEKTVCFNCYNTAWMSSKDEKVGKMFFPCDIIPSEITEDINTLTISVFHHPLNWFNPSTEPNNKRQFTQCLKNNSQILLYGHEHESEHVKTQDIESKDETLFIAGQALQNEKDNSSGFKTIRIDINTKNGIIKEYIWRKDLYTLPKEATTFAIDGNKRSEGKFVPTAATLITLDDLSLPLKFETRKNVKLSDIFVYPDLEKMSTREKRIDEVYNSKKIIKENIKLIGLEGDVQSGKTSLLNIFYLDFLKLGKYPILIEAKKLMSNNIEKVVKRCFEEQYKSNGSDFECFRQHNIEDKILLIDNLQDFTYNGATLVQVIKELNLSFGQIIFSTTTFFSFSSALNAEFENLAYYFIQPLGYKKRNELIEKYHILNESPLTVTDQLILEKTKFHFDQIQTVLGNQLIPAHPVYILSILQTLIYANSPNLEQTSLGYCYQSLLYVALVDKAKIRNDEVDAYFNFLSELAFSLYQTNDDSFTDEYFNEFYRLYSDRFIAKGLTRDKLLASNIIITSNENEYRFRYNYIFYFLISRKIVDLLGEDTGKQIVSTLCRNLANEKSANILIFTTHHSKDNYLIDEATLSLMLPYEHYIPVTLDTNDEYYVQIEEIIKEISSNIIEGNKNPNDERTKNLEKTDQLRTVYKSEAKNSTEIEKENEECNELIEEMVHALKSLEIVGQIIKNRKGSIDKSKLTTMIRELYNTAFRTITFFGEISKLTQDELITSLKNKIAEDDSRAIVEQKIGKFFQYMLFQQCLAVFSRIIYSVGNKDLKDIFIDVSKEMNTPAAKLVTFSILSNYDKIRVKDLKKIIQELDGNYVALSILKARVRAYVYNNHLDYKEKQQIASALNMKILT